MNSSSSLLQAAQFIQCPEHKQKVKYINISNDCPSGKRVLCSKCVHEGKTIKLNTINDLLIEISKTTNTKIATLNEQQATFTKEIKKIYENIENVQLLFQNESKRIEEQYKNDIKISSDKLKKMMQNEESENDDIQLTLIDLQQIGDLVSHYFTIEGQTYHQNQIAGPDVKPLQQLIEQLQGLNTYIEQQSKITNISQKTRFVQFEKWQTLEINRKSIYALNCNEMQLIIGTDQSSNIENLFQCQLTEDYKIQSKQVLKGHTNSINQLAYNPKNQSIYSCSDDRTVQVWKLNDQNQFVSIQKINLNKFVNTLSISPDFQLLAASDISSAIYIWEINKQGQLDKIDTCKRNSESIFSLSFDQRSEILASGCQNQSIVLWKRNQYNGRFYYYQTLCQHKQAVKVVCFNPKASILISGGEDQSIQVWDYRFEQFILNQEIKVHEQEINTIKFRKDGLLFGVGSSDGKITLWILVNKLWVISQKIDCENLVFCLDFSQDLLVAGVSDNILVFREKQNKLNNQ